ncbi:MAG: hypothetical protein HQL87_10815 [Magnetococcales bacterium]|nr:hypothetical protein [Magnetococcales bacterium]
MAMYLNTNLPSLTVQRNMASASGSLNTVYARLSSGMRINTASDDPAGLAISNRMTAQIRGTSQAVSNSNDGVSVAQVAEGSLSEDANMLQRISQLSVQAANATNSDSDRQSLQDEASQLLNQIEQIAQNTTFNGWTVLNGHQQPLVFQVGSQQGQTITVNMADARAATLLAQPVPVDPNSPVSLFNQQVPGVTITAPNPPLSGSRLFASEMGPMVNAVASTNDVNKLTQPYTYTLDASNVARNMAVVAGASVATAMTISSQAAAMAGNDPTAVAAGTAGGGASPAVSALIAAQVSAESAAGAAGTAVAPPSVSDVITALEGSTPATINAATEVDASGNYTGTNAVALAAINAARGLTSDGVTKISGGSSWDNVVSAAIGAQITATAASDASYTVFADNTDKARVLAAGLYAANKSYSTSDGVPPAYKSLAGATGGAVVNATGATDVVDSAVKTGGTDTAGNGGIPLVKDVPVGNILNVIKAFDAGISKGETVDQVARDAVAADAGTGGKKNLTLDQAKIIAAAGLAAAAPGNTQKDASVAAVNMAKVLAARDASAAAAPAPVPGSQVTVPSWLINTKGQNSYPPVPLVDMTGKTIPTDPTLEFDPPNTDAGGSKPYNPPLDGQAAAGRMLSVVMGGINQVSSIRAELGAVESRFTSNIANLQNVVENLTAARSQITDTDVAAETANLTKLSILQQAGTAILAQANQLPQLVLQLLK